MNDQHGHGGSYVIDKDGNRVLVERTREGPPAKTNEPADAGFFSSNADAEPAASTVDSATNDKE